MDIILIVVGCIIAFFFLRYVINKIFHTAKAKKYSKEMAEINRKFIELIKHDFEKNGWTTWQPHTHTMPGQLERLKRAADPNADIHLIHYNPKNGMAKILGTEGKYYLVCEKRCSCPDFRERQLPCKHMYFLATILDEYETHIDYDIEPEDNYEVENSLWGLQFSIAGRNQDSIKEYIVEHGGSYGNSSWKETSAVILADNPASQRLDIAADKNVQVLTFDELKKLFDI